MTLRLLFLHKSRFKEHLAFPEEEDDEDGGDGRPCSVGGALVLHPPLPFSSSEPAAAQSRFTPNSRTRLEADDATTGGGGSACCPGVVGNRTGTESSTTVEGCWWWCGR